VRTTPGRISPETFPIAATATAPAYDFPAEKAPARAPERAAPLPIRGQQPLFSGNAFEPRIIPFDSLTTQSERDSIRARAADIARPEPLKNPSVGLPRPKPKKSRNVDQRHLDFMGQEEVLAPTEQSIICDAPVAPVALRLEAALIDSFPVVVIWALGIAGFKYSGAAFALDKHVLPFVVLAFLTVPFFYKLLWTFAGRDSIGLTKAGLRLVDFDGNPPSHSRRYQRFLGTILSVSAAGVGLIWSLVDEDGLTWHDHISSTFPTIASSVIDRQF
jgi:uncharacterized RDD family membrane protein YckC